MTQLPPENDAQNQPEGLPAAPQQPAAPQADAVQAEPSQPLVPPLAPTLGQPETVSHANVLGGAPAPAPTFAHEPQQPQQPQYAPQPQFGQQAQFAPQPPAQPGPPGYPGQRGPYGLPYQNMPVSKPPMNVLALIGFIGSFFFGLVGVILGHIALSQIKRKGESGRGFALAATIIGYARIAVEVITVIIFISTLGFIGSMASASYTGSTDQPEQYGQEQEEQPDDSSDFSSGPRPWDGTEEAAFCSALDNWELSYSDEVRYYEDILANTDDAELSALVEAQIGYVGVDIFELSDEEYDEYVASTDKWSDAHEAALNTCYGE